MLPDAGLKVLKKILERHNSMRPPFSIEVFSLGDCKRIIEFAINTFFRHYSLYEFAFKPRMELVLRVDKFNNQKFNSEIPKLEECLELEEEEASKFKALLGGIKQNEEAAEGLLDGGLVAQRAAEEEEERRRQEEAERAAQEALEQENMPTPEPELDKKKLGKMYKGPEEVDLVIAREVNRMKKAYDMAAQRSDNQMEEVVASHLTKKKK